MVPIYLCDDEEGIRTCFAQQIKEYILIQEYDMPVVCETASPNVLLNIIARQSERGIYFLDVNLRNDEYNGFSLAREIRRQDEQAFIIFVTTRDELTFETFNQYTEGMDYIIKDESGSISKRIRECLDLIQRKLVLKISPTSSYYTVSIFGAIYYIPIKDILYFETSEKKHRLIMHRENGLLEFFGNLSEVGMKLGGNFLRTHRSFLVNREKIETFYSSKNRIELINGTFIPVSRILKHRLKAKLPK